MRGKAKFLAARPLNLNNIRTMQRKLVTGKGARVYLRKINHADPFKGLGHAATLLSGCSFDITLTTRFCYLFVTVKLRPPTRNLLIRHLLNIAEIQFPTCILAPTKW